MIQPLAEHIASYRGQGRSALLPLLWEIQTAEGYIGPDAVQQISYALRVPEADIYGVIQFYSLFTDKPTGERIVRICTDPSCSLMGGESLLHNAHALPNEHLDTHCEATTCLGMCEQAPAALISRRGQREIAVGNLTHANQLFAEPTTYATSQAFASDLNVLLTGDEATLADYGDYAALRRALNDLTPEALIAEIEASHLIGRGGAAFPTGLKWKFTRSTDAMTRYVVVNADESEPGTFKDRLLMEQRPHLLLEGMLLAAYAISAQQGYIFVRGEYPHATERLQNAIDEAQQAGLIGDHIFNSGFSFSVEIRRGAGAYICGEETALFEAIEGKRGFPRIKPPYPTTHGLFNQPTVVNNVETLCNVPGIVQNGEVWFRQFGTEKSSGPKLVCVSGHVQRAGVYEISPGITLREVLQRHCGGVIGDLQAVLMGGAAGTFLSPEQLDIRLTFEDLHAIGSTFGSGAIIVFNHTVDLHNVLFQLARFFQHESCGKCFPCQLGTQRQLEILAHPPTPGDKQRLQDIGITMTESSLCGLGQTASSALLSAMRQWPELFEE